MVLHAVKTTDLEAALASARTEASLILDQVNVIQNELQKTSFVGEQAESLAEEMNATMSTFVAATYDNIDELIRLIVNNMNVVVTKLGGAPWAHQPVERGRTASAQALRISRNQDYEIDTDEMTAFAANVDQWFEAIATGYHNIGSTIAEGTPGWQGPEKMTTVGAISTALTEIVGTGGDVGGTGVRGVGTSLSALLRAQVDVMGGGA